MLFLSFFFLSYCFSVSTNSAIEEFQENFKALVNLTNKELFLEVPGRFQCSCVRDYLKKTMKQLNTKDYLRNDQTRGLIYVMESNANHIIATFHQAHAETGRKGSCGTKEKSLQRALQVYKRFFQQLQESCQAAAAP